MANPVPLLVQDLIAADLPAIRAAIAAGAAVNLNNGMRTPLMWLATPVVFRPDAKQCMLLLLDSDAEIDAVDNLGNTALHMACNRPTFGAVQVLVEYGCRIDIQNGRGVTAYYLCAEQRDTATAQYLELRLRFNVLRALVDVFPDVPAAVLELLADFVTSL